MTFIYISDTIFRFCVIFVTFPLLLSSWLLLLLLLLWFLWLVMG